MPNGESSSSSMGPLDKRISSATDILNYIIIVNEKYFEDPVLWGKKIDLSEQANIQVRHAEYYENSAYELLPGQVWDVTPINEINIKINGEWVHYPLLLRDCRCQVQQQPWRCRTQHDTMYDCHLAGCPCCSEECDSHG